MADYPGFQNPNIVGIYPTGYIPTGAAAATEKTLSSQYAAKLEEIKLQRAKTEKYTKERDKLATASRDWVKYAIEKNLTGEEAIRLYPDFVATYGVDKGIFGQLVDEERLRGTMDAIQSAFGRKEKEAWATVKAKAGAGGAAIRPADIQKLYAYKENLFDKIESENPVIKQWRETKEKIDELKREGKQNSDEYSALEDEYDEYSTRIRDVREQKPDVDRIMDEIERTDKRIKSYSGYLPYEPQPKFKKPEKPEPEWYKK